jgi:hypothetical protein
MRERLARLPGWIDRLWPWGPIVLVVLAVLTGLNSIANRPPPSDTDRIADVIRDFGKAVDDRRGEDACALLTPAAQRELVAEVPTVTCPVAVRSFGLGFDPRALGDASIRAITVQGTTGIIRRADLTTAGGVAIGLEPRFAKVGGDWKIAALGRPTSP